MILYLYVKKHNKTGLKYLGFTKNDPDSYRGSGHYWKQHILKHKYDVTTKIIAAFDNIEDLREAGLYYSKLWNVVESDEWANLKLEEGDGGHGLVHNEKTKHQISKKLTGRKISPEHLQNSIKAQNRPEVIEKHRQNNLGKNNPRYGKKHTRETKELIRQKILQQWLTSRSKSLPFSSDQFPF